SARTGTAKVGVNVIKAGVDISHADVFTVNSKRRLDPKGPGPEEIDIRKRAGVELRMHRMHRFYSGHRGDLRDLVGRDDHRDTVVSAGRTEEHTGADVLAGQIGQSSSLQIVKLTNFAGDF